MTSYLCGLCFPGTGRSCWGTAKLEMQSSGQSQIASVSERRDDQTSCVAEVLVLIGELSIDGPRIEIAINPVVSRGKTG